MNSKKIVNTIYYIVISMLVIILVNNFMSKSDSIFKAVGFRTYSILSGSMEPEINTGDLAIVKSVDAEDVKEGAKQALIEGYEGEGGIDELRDYDGITVTSDWTGEAMVSEIEIDPDKVDFDDIKNSEDLGEICKMIKTYSPTLFIKNMEKNGFKEVK